MSDLVKRLRQCGRVRSKKRGWEPDVMCTEAADRIEALEKALAIFMQFEGRDEEYTWIDQALFREARAALKDAAP